MIKIERNLYKEEIIKYPLRTVILIINLQRSERNIHLTMREENSSPN